MVEAGQKHVELLRTLVPKLALLIIVWHADRAPFVAENSRPIATATRAAGLATRTSLVADLTDLRRALRADRGPREVGAMVFNLGDGFDRKAVAETALAAGMPTMFEDRSYVDAGGLASYRFDWDNWIQRFAAQIDKVFRGEKPAQIPFELPTRSEFVLNRKTARALGLSVPQSLVLQADAIVE